MSLLASSFFGDRTTACALRLTRAAAAGMLMALVSGCSVLAVADAAVTVAATAVSVTATVVETTVDVAAAGVRAVTADDKDPKKADEGQTEDRPGTEPRPEPAQEAPAAPQRTWQAPEWPVSR